MDGFETTEITGINGAAHVAAKRGAWELAPGCADLAFGDTAPNDAVSQVAETTARRGGIIDEALPLPTATEPPISPWETLIRRPVPDEWFTSAPPRRRWLLRDSRRNAASGLFLLGKTGMLIAEGGAGKTQVNTQLALAVATGTPLLGAFEVATPGRVLLILGEEGADDVHRRIYYASRSLRIPTPATDSIVVLPLEGVPCAMLEADRNGHMRETEFAKWLYAWILGEATRGAFVLAILDPLSRFGGPEAETENASATRFVQAVERISTVTGGSALVSHHTTKASRDGGKVSASAGRGASALGDGFRWGASMSVTKASNLGSVEEQERLGEIVTLSFTKANGHRKGDPVSLRWTQDGVLVPLDDDDALTVAQVTSRSTERQARATEKETERAQRLATREAEKVAKAAEKVARKEAKVRARNDADDAAARELELANPGTPGRTLKAILMKERACGSDRAFAALARVRGTS